VPVSPESPYLQITKQREDLVSHPLYVELDDLRWIRLFAKHHVFAVWDFMSLLKALQRAVTCVQVPWVPVGAPKVRRFVNEIVLGEESDEDGQGGYQSHFELYREAMRACGADETPIERFLETLAATRDWECALDAAAVPEFVQQFVRNTMEIALSGKPHCLAAAFFYGREDVIPDMFRGFVNNLHGTSTPELGRFVYYIERHITVDGDSHGPLARHMTTMLCQNNRTFHREAVEVALRSLETRLALWDGVLAEIRAAKQRDEPRGAHGGAKIAEGVRSGPRVPAETAPGLSGRRPASAEPEPRDQPRSIGVDGEL
jgi:hypothetical protein